MKRRRQLEALIHRSVNLRIRLLRRRRRLQQSLAERALSSVRALIADPREPELGATPTEDGTTAVKQLASRARQRLLARSIAETYSNPRPAGLEYS